MHGSSFFSFHLLSFSISFPKLTIFTILRLYMVCKMWKITALTWEILRMVEKFHISDFPHVFILYIIGLESMITKLKKNVCFESRKKDTKTSTKRHERNDTKWTIWYFQQCACVNAIYFAPVVSTTYRTKNNKSSTRGLSLEKGALARARAQLLNIPYIGTLLSEPHGENI